MCSRGSLDVRASGQSPVRRRAHAKTQHRSGCGLISAEAAHRFYALHSAAHCPSIPTTIPCRAEHRCLHKSTVFHRPFGEPWEPVLARTCQIAEPLLAEPKGQAGPLLAVAVALTLEEARQEGPLPKQGQALAQPRPPRSPALAQPEQGPAPAQEPEQVAGSAAGPLTLPRPVSGARGS